MRKKKRKKNSSDSLRRFLTNQSSPDSFHKEVRPTMLLCSTLIRYAHQLRAAGSDLQITFKQEGSQAPLQRLGLVQPVYISSVVSAMYVVICFLPGWRAVSFHFKNKCISTSQWDFSTLGFLYLKLRDTFARCIWHVNYDAPATPCPRLCSSNECKEMLTHEGEKLLCIY